MDGGSQAEGTETEIIPPIKQRDGDEESEKYDRKAETLDNEEESDEDAETLYRFVTWEELSRAQRYDSV